LGGTFVTAILTNIDTGFSANYCFRGGGAGLSVKKVPLKGGFTFSLTPKSFKTTLGGVDRFVTFKSFVGQGKVIGADFVPGKGKGLGCIEFSNVTTDQPLDCIDVSGDQVGFSIGFGLSVGEWILSDTCPS